MSATVEKLVRAALAAAQEDGSLPEFEVEDLGLERPADPSNGDWTTTLAMRAAKLARKSPRDIATALLEHLPEDAAVERAEIAGPGFLNFYLSAATNNAVFADAREKGTDFGRSDLGAGQKVQVEFVSANPVGPMHIGHGRWAALGDSLCRVMEHAGYDVQREFYINDHGSQMDVFGGSISERYMQLLAIMDERGCTPEQAQEVLIADREAAMDDEDGTAPETHPFTDAFNEHLGGNAYGGEYIIDLARGFVERDGAKWAELADAERIAEFRESAYRLMVEDMRTTCADANCEFDNWFSERSLYVEGEDGLNRVTRAFDTLDKAGYLYTDEGGALWFRSTAFGDDKDRVLVKTNGEYTYFASDVAYHWDKFQRVEHVIDIWGADHHGYIKRVESACDALGYPGKFEVLLGQLVNLLRNGNPVRMSKRRGTMVTFRELLDEVGCDATRYTLVSKSSNQTIDFDIEQAKKRDNTNPVYYVQYAHARICSILRRAAGVEFEAAQELGMDEVVSRAIPAQADLSLLTDPTEEALARKLAEFEGLVAGAARDRAPFRLTHYAEELAAAFHSFYTNCHVLAGAVGDVDEELSAARLAVCDAVRITLACALNLVGVSAPERM